MSALNSFLAQGRSEPFPELPRVITVRELLSDSLLRIPDYQRPYKWNERHIQQLFGDLANHKDKLAYRLGTIVFHRDADGHNIVDGQQRTVSLILTIRALNKAVAEGKKIERKDLLQQLSALQEAGRSFRFPSEVSRQNIVQNYQEILRIVSRSDFTEAHIDFLLNHCQVVTFTLGDLAEAFQFFDSQNSRGRDLEPHDLLKAFHLREFGVGEDDVVKKTAVERWEASETQELVSLFAQYLFRIRNWSRGRSARWYFGKEHIGLFKGVNLQTIARFPYVESLRISHEFVDHYNQQYERRIDGQKAGFPFHLDQIVINGRRFFEMIAHYQSLVGRITADSKDSRALTDGQKLDGFAEEILSVINSYDARWRTGDRYTRSIFDCLLVTYVDKFGVEELSRAIEKTFIWAYRLRLQMRTVQLASMDNYVLENNLFAVIKDATRPADFLQRSLQSVREVNSSGTEKIETLFARMHYHRKPVHE